MKRKYIAAVLTVFAMTTVCSTAFASTEHYTDSSIVGAETGWDEWVANWDETASDFTKVSLTPGKDDTELNFHGTVKRQMQLQHLLFISEQTRMLWIRSKELQEK